MKAQGFDNNQIIESLQRDGYSSAQIFTALNQVDMAPGSDLGAAGYEEPGEHYAAPEYPPAPQAQPAQPRGIGSQQAYATTDYQEHVRGSETSFEQANTEELVEAIIDEKWNDLVKDINKIIDWKNETETKIISLEQKFTMLKDQFDKLHQAIIGKIGEYDRHILDVGAEVRAMEKVFSKVLPVFTENVRELSRITDEMKGK